MTIDQILAEWSTDSQIKATDVDEAAMRTIKHHAKYLAYMREASKALRNADAQLKAIYTERHNYYSGRVKDANGKLYPFRLDKSEIKHHIESDPVYATAKITEGEFAEMVSILRDIIEAINRRGFLLKTIVDYQRFKNGLN